MVQMFGLFCFGGFFVQLILIKLTTAAGLDESGGEIKGNKM